ncbi:hypothetical protein DFQ28_005333 [Apophysomyces sp. BC1034]|nr:hypothetical protein DFQ30_005167 [Apophysomyces sp. BC1015]KAG0177878.1 hypothetical protein DFQ29_004246 [Apophysomyces sp. BC1021]KAG0188132.1 hypothetical protein DFQ28_005333 [Apophysomyces sp. BC1034]
MAHHHNSILTTSNGNPVENDQTSITAGQWGPVLIQDFHTIDKLAHFARERIPERVVHARGAGAHGYFEVTHDITHLTKAKFLNKVGKKTPIFARFSTVGLERGSPDIVRDPRGFAVKFYTEEGNWDMVGNNTPIFFVRDSGKFPDFIHSQKRNPQTNLPDPDAFWDFLSLVPESIHQVTILFSDRGTPDGFRHINGYSSHALKLVNDKGDTKYVKWHFKTDQGIKNLTAEDLETMMNNDPDYSTRDLFNAIHHGQNPSWSVYIQVIDPKEVETYRWNPFDLTKVLPHNDFPLHPVGKMVLNRNPANYFAETEQAAFSPGNMVPGIEPSADRVLQGRLFSYADAQRYRLGPNFNQIPINRPLSTSTYQRDGPMTVTDNGGSLPNYEPNSLHGPAQTNQSSTTFTPEVVHGHTGRFSYRLTDDDFVQAGNLYRLLSTEERTRLVHNIANHLFGARQSIQERQIAHFKRADQEYGDRVESLLLNLSQLRAK